jgi:hypothetical protein
MTRLHATLTAFVLLLASGLLHGLYVERWHASEALEKAATRLERVPLVIGPWRARAEASDAEEFDQAGARGYWTRTYTHSRSKQSVLVILMCGRPGRMAVHTPQVCYRGAGYDMPGDATRFLVADGAFWTATFSKPTGLASDLRLYWAWNAGTGWEAADNPRWQFRGEEVLYKLYVAHDLTGAPDPGPAADPAAEFLRQFLPELSQTVFP